MMTSVSSIIINVNNKPEYDEVQFTQRSSISEMSKYLVNLFELQRSSISEMSKYLVNYSAINPVYVSIFEDSYFVENLNQLIKSDNIYIYPIYQNYSTQFIKNSKTYIYKITVSELVTKITSHKWINKSDFPNRCTDETCEATSNLQILVDENDSNLISVGEAIIHVQYDKYYDNIYQFSKEFTDRIGSSFRIEGLTESILFNYQEHYLSGYIYFTRDKTLKFIINDKYKFTLTLKVDVRECTAF